MVEGTGPVPHLAQHAVLQHRSRGRRDAGGVCRAVDLPRARSQVRRPTSVESDAVHAAFPFLETLFCPWGERSASAHVRSFFVSGPPVCCSASSSISLHPAASKRATPTACFTK